MSTNAATMAMTTTAMARMPGMVSPMSKVCRTSLACAPHEDKGLEDQSLHSFPAHIAQAFTPGWNLEMFCL